MVAWVSLLFHRDILASLGGHEFTLVFPESDHRGDNLFFFNKSTSRQCLTLAKIVFPSGK